ncbi:uncharacterized protein PAC_15369 [Phialocephala subalpina]|uniref:Heterokaryon incompatibility domain-containing protein n=1 Tax=Phialocephala subalpina TaxID=576137 RepID=A0A1L7XK94_9HELO|nr:uncharacterized protein PAC_15369 [Phialocephala subalpina]
MKLSSRRSLTLAVFNTTTRTRRKLGRGKPPNGHPSLQAGSVGIEDAEFHPWSRRGSGKFRIGGGTRWQRHIQWPSLVLTFSAWNAMMFNWWKSRHVSNHLPVPGDSPRPIFVSNTMNHVFTSTKIQSVGSNTIRLKLHPGHQNAVIECELEVFDLEARPRFEALSYVWGNTNPPGIITCNGQQHPVTPNLALALKRLRLPDTTRIVWIDAICVNQEDLEERSQQVQLMRVIYSQAWRVVVWLGEDSGLATTVAVAATWVFWNVDHPPQRGVVNIYSRAEEAFTQEEKTGAYLEDFVARDLMKYSNATDPRDKIYTFLGLLHDSDQKSNLIQPDYTRPVSQVYGDVVRQMLLENEEDGATNLTEAFAAIEKFDVETGDFPSWIPRNKIPQVRQTAEHPILVLKGMKVARIAYIFPLQRKSGDGDWLRHLWKEVSSFLDAGPWAETKKIVFLKAIGGAYYREFSENVEAASVDSCKSFLEMTFICCGIEYDKDENPKDEFNLREGLDIYLEPGLVAATIEANLDACTVLASYVHLYPFSLFVTEDNNLGIGARSAKVGNRVCVLFGGKIPFLLRPAGDQYIFMEACYMNDFMPGEGIDEMETGERGAEWFEIR